MLVATTVLSGRKIFLVSKGGITGRAANLCLGDTALFHRGARRIFITMILDQSKRTDYAPSHAV